MSREQPAHPLRGLLTTGPRLGWRYRDPVAAMVPYAEPAPFGPGPPSVVVRPLPVRRLVVAAGVGFAMALLVGCCGRIAAGPSGQGSAGSLMFVVAFGLLVGTGALVAVLVWAHWRGNAAVVERALRPAREFEAAMAVWRQRAAAHERAELARVASLPVWQSAGLRPGTVRLDIVGGTPTGWRDLITVAGAGYLAANGPSMVVDLTGDGVATDLYDLCQTSGVDVDWQRPPVDTDLLSGLDSVQLVEVLVESVHGEGDRELRDRRATDIRILASVTAALGADVSVDRMADALRVLLKIPDETPTLTVAERRHIADGLFPLDYLSASMPALQRLEAHLHALRGMRVRARRPATLTIVGTVNDGTSARTELLDDLVLAWVTRRVANQPQLCRTLLIAGADRLPGRQVQRLADICLRQGVTLILLWRNLRDAAQIALGGGTVGFMRLANGEEANRAADFIGRTYRFEISGLTRTVGGSTTSTDSLGVSDTVSRGTASAIGRGRLGELIRQAQTWNQSQGVTTGTSRATTRQTSTALGDTWTDATSSQRVYQYTIEPTTLQGLPEQALLLVEHHQSTATVTAVECNPVIVTLPAVAMNPGLVTASPPTAIPWQARRTSLGASHHPVPAQPGTADPSRPAELWPEEDW